MSYQQYSIIRISAINIQVEQMGSCFCFHPSQIVSLKKKNDSYQKELQKVYQEVGRIKSGQSSITTEQCHSQQELQDNKEQIQQNTPSSTPIKFFFNWDMTNVNNNTVRIKGKQITMGSTGYESQKKHYKIFSEQSFPQQGVYKVTFRINKFMSNTRDPISFGLTATKKHFITYNNNNEDQLVAYYSSQVSGRGVIKIGGSQIYAENVDKYKMGATVGEEVQMVMNMDKLEINFTRKANKSRPQIKISDLFLPSTFINKSLYVVIQLSNYGDIVEVI